MKQMNRLLLVFLASWLAPGLIFGQEAFDATYDLGDNNALVNYPSVPDGDGGFWVFRYKYYTPESVSAITAVHLSSEGAVLAAEYCAHPDLKTPVQAVQGANSTFWVLGNGGLDGVYSLLHLAMDGGFISLKTFPVFGTRQPSLTLDGNDLYVLLNSQQSDPFGVTTHVLKLDQDGTVVQQLAFRGDSLDFLFEGMQWVEGVGLVLAGRSFQNQSSLAVIGLDSSLNVQWAHTGPSIPFSSNLPLLVRELNGPLVAVVWSADNPEPLGGLLVLNASGEVVESFSHTMSDVADVQPLQDNGWLFLRGFIQGPILLRHFGEDGIQLGSGSTSGTLVGQLWANGIEGSWTVLSGSWNTGDMSMARFNLEDGTCLPDPTMPVNLSADTVQLQPLALHTVELPVPIGSGECLTYPLEVTRTVNCGTLAVEELHATNIRCQQLQASGQGVAIVLHGDLPNNAEVQLFDAMGRELPTNVFQTETQKMGTRLLELPYTPTSGMGILRIQGKQASTSCKVVFGM